MYLRDSLFCHVTLSACFVQVQTLEDVLSSQMGIESVTRMLANCKVR